VISRTSDSIAAVVARLVPRLPAPLVRLLAGPPIERDGQSLAPQLQLGLRLERLLGEWRPAPVAEARARRRRDARVFGGPRIELERTEEIELPGPAGPIRSRLFVPPGRGRRPPLLVYFHGGGHVICDLDTHDQPCRFLAREVPAMVLSIDYRLGPEHRFPAAVEDSLAAHAWAQENAERLGADPGRVAVAGDSAGGNLAAVVAQLAAVADRSPPVHQTLIYPVIDYSVERPSYELFAEGFFLTREDMHWFRDHYLTDDADRLDPRVSPILTEDLAGLAPAHVVTCGFDPLRDEGEAYAQRLREAGVPTTLVRERDLVHGFVNAAGLGGRAAEATAAIAAAIGTALATRRETAPATLTSPPG
jgi:acetyl esterase